MTEESVSADQGLEKKILEVMSQNPKGISSAKMQDSIPSMNIQQLVDCLNKLLSQHKVQLLSKGNQTFYKLKDGPGQQYKGTDIEEKIIFDAIARAGNTGIMPKDLKRQCRLALPQIHKILKVLEGKKMVKFFQPSPQKKIYMLYDIEPSETVTGGIFYSGQEFEAEFVNVLGDQCYRYLLQARGVADKLSDPIAQRNASYKSSKEICDYINCLKISKVKLTLKDMESILEALIYDDKIEKCVSMSKMSSATEKVLENLYRASKPFSGSLGMMMVPCGICKVHQDCHVGGEISPATCEYMQQWLAF